MEIPLFEQTGELTRALVDEEFGPVRFKAHRRGVKVWFGAVKPSRFHYEAQLIPHRFGPGAGPDETTIEVGFHAEHRDEGKNLAVIEHLRKNEKVWRKPLGAEAEAGPFLGNDHWGRLSETWIEADFDEPSLAFELASRLVDYIHTIEPLLDDVAE